MSLLEIHKLTHSFGDNVLYKDAELLLNKGEHVGIVGQNGSGKSTLVKICTEQILPDKGSLVWQPKISIGYLDQYADIDRSMTMNEYLKTAFSELYTIEKNLSKLYENMDQCSCEELELTTQYQDKLDASEFYFIDTKIAKVVAGLGLDSIGVDKPIGEMSGGQRAKIILAKLLLSNPDILILDEPTNFLDVEHIAWFTEYLSKFKNAFMIVSHDYSFLESVTNCIVDIDNCKLEKYYGTYSEFLKKKTLLRENYVKQYANQQKEIKKTEEFIRKNIAGRKSKMARGRQKQLDRMEKMEALQTKEKSPVFHFKQIPLTATEHLIVCNLDVGYYYPLLSNINFCIKGGEKIVITGFNGVGKSTLLKTLVGQIEVLGGNFTFSQQVVLGYFEQELRWENLDKSPIEIVLDFYPTLTNKEIRNKLAACGISGKLAIQPVATLSGGEQVKLKLCILMQKRYNFIILDEPTNHLDARAKESLKQAIINFEGTVLIVSHEREFYSSWADRVINIEESIRKIR